MTLDGIPAAALARRWRVLEDRPCMLIYWPSNIPKPEKACGSNRNCRAICVVYVMPWLRKAAARLGNDANRPIETMA